jgi:hypothetical protein
MSENQPKDKKEILVLNVFSKVFLVLGFIAFFMSLILDSSYPDKNWISYGIIVFFVFLGGYLGSKSIIKRDLEKYGFKNKKDLYESIDLKEVEYNSIEVLKDDLLKHNYELLSNGYYFKKVASQGVCYYGKFISDKDIEGSLDKEVVKLRRFYNNGCNKISATLFFEFDSVSENEKDIVKKISKEYLVKEELNTAKFFTSLIVVLLDKDKGYYFDIPDSFNTKVYTYGCLNIRKVFNSKKK